VRPEVLVQRAVTFDGKSLSVRDINRNIVKVKFDRVYVVGAGKAASGMTNALHSILKDKIADGAITVPYGTKTNNNRITITQAAHPVPDSSGLAGANRILDVLKLAKQNDLVVVLVSGGGSALMPMPARGISLSDKQRITTLLLQSGASIQEMNIVRKHLSAIKGGQLLRYIDRSCTVVSLVISDVIDDDLASIASGPTCPDDSTFEDALKILKKYQLAKSSNPVIKHLEMGARGRIKDTPKTRDPIFSKTHNMIVGNNAIACNSAANYFKQHSIYSVNLGSKFAGEARAFGKFLARFAYKFEDSPFAIIAGGETTVKLNTKKNGTGGRNQEAALAYAIEVRDGRNITAAFMGTDGIDGNSDAAGALVTPKTVSLSKSMQLQKYQDRHDSYNALDRMNSLIFTGYTGTNVNDIAVMVYS